MITVSHPTGNEFVRALLIGLLERDLLETFHTTIDTSALKQLLPASMAAAFGRRAFPVPPNKLKTMPLRECARLAAPLLGWSALSEHVPERLQCLFHEQPAKSIFAQ